MSSAIYPVIGLVGSGVGYNVIRKLLFQLQAVGLHGLQHAFQKPLWTSFISSLGWTCCFLLYWAQLWHHKRQLQQTDNKMQPLLQDQEATDRGQAAHNGEQQAAQRATPHAQQMPWHECMSKEAYRKGQYGHSWDHLARLSAPAITGVVSLILQGIGLRYIAASISLVMSSSVVVFTALLAVICLKRRLIWLHWLGIGLAVCGILATSLVDPLTRRIDTRRKHDSLYSTTGLGNGASEQHWGARQGYAGWLAAAEEPTAGQVLLGIGLTLASQFMGAVQMVLEESLLGGRFKLHPLQLLGYEGAIGAAFMGLLALPGAYFAPGDDVDGRYENTLDTLDMLRHNTHIGALNFALLLCSLVTNWTGVIVTARLGSVFRSVLMTVRTGLVWLIDLGIFYSGLGAGLLGERWTSGSPLELVGFVLSVSGVVMYSQGNSRVACAHAAVQQAAIHPHSPAAWRIVRDIFLPQHRHLPVDHPSMADHAAQAHAQAFPSEADLHAVPWHVTFMRSLFARSSWVLDRHHVDPALHVGTLQFRELFPRLPHAFKRFENGDEDEPLVA